MPLLRVEPRVADLMTRDVFTLSPAHSLPLAEAMMELRHIRHIPIVDDERRVVGIVTHRDLLGARLSALSPLSDDERSSLQLAVPIAKIMQRDVWTVTHDTTARRAAELLRDHRFGCLPVTEHGRLVGILTESDLMRLVAEPSSLAPPPGTWPVRHFMTAAPVTVTTETTLAAARLEIERHRIHHLPIVDGGRPIGLIHERDIAVAEAVFGAAEDTRAVHVASLLGTVNASQVRPEDSLARVLSLLVAQRIDAVLVVEAEILAGIFTLVDGCRVLADLTALDLTAGTTR